MTGSASVIRANARDLPLPDNSVDLVVTSPPYFALRSYQDGGEHYEGQIGSEPTPAEFVAALLEVTRECVRVLKPSGSLWVNLGDKYAGSRMDGSSGNGTGGLANGQGHIDYFNTMTQGRVASSGSVRAKSLMGIPWRYALACIDDLGLILRAEVIWSKPNGLPESVTDRVRRSHEQWFHFTLNPRYFSAVDEIREEHTGEFLSSGARNPRHGRAGGLMPHEALGLDSAGAIERTAAAGRDYEKSGANHPKSLNPLGKLPGSVWTVPTQPLRVPEHLGIDHFAAFPMEWPRRIIQGWSPSGVCTGCGEGRRPVVDKGGVTPEAAALIEKRNAVDNYSTNARGNGDKALRETHKLSGTERARLFAPASITGESCACPEPTAPTAPAVVLDPFGGTGTTALVAKALGRHGITVDMSADYCRLATWRTNDPAELARAKQVDKPAEQVKGQADLFDLIEGTAS